MEYPIAKKKATVLSAHGDERVDEYYWMNDRNNPEVIEYLEAENAYRKKMMEPLKSFQEKLYQEIIGRIKKTDMSVPYFSNGYFYYTRFEEGAEYALYCRKKDSLDAPEMMLLNVPEMAKGYPYYSIGGLSVSPDNLTMAFSVDTVSRRQYSIYFKMLSTGEMVPTFIPNTTGSVVWANDNQTIFYTTKNESLRAFKVFRHTVGSDPSNDVCVWEEKDETFNTFVFKSKSKKYLVIGSASTVSNEYRFVEADRPSGDFQLFQPRERDLEYTLDHYGAEFYINTNLNARNFRLMKTAESRTDKSNWEEVIPHREDVLLEGLEIFKDWLVLSERKEGVTRLRIMKRSGGDHYIDFGETVYMAYTGVNREADSDVLRLGYASLTTPNSVFDYQMETRHLTLLKQEEVVGGVFDPRLYQAERAYATAPDGAKVPVSLVYRKSKFQKNGSAPLLLYGYGSYGQSMDPYFSSARLSLLDRGFVFAIAHIRGGQELGRRWYEDGKLLKKKNTFTDFIACAEYLVAQNYSAPDHLFAMGGSAGGLLVGTVMNMRPDLWKAVVAQVPFVDVVTTMMDESIPLTTGEFDEWGDPKQKPFYDYMKSYSPYDNVEAKAYPAMLATTGLHDSQVQYWEPAKWVAKLRELKTNQAQLLMYCNMSTGHGGASGRWERYKEIAMEYAFLLDQAGLSEKEG